MSKLRKNVIDYVKDLSHDFIGKSSHNLMRTNNMDWKKGYENEISWIDRSNFISDELSFQVRKDKRVISSGYSVVAPFDGKVVFAEAEGKLYPYDNYLGKDINGHWNVEVNKTSDWNGIGIISKDKSIWFWYPNTKDYSVLDYTRTGNFRLSNGSSVKKGNLLFQIRFDWKFFVMVSDDKYSFFYDYTQNFPSIHTIKSCDLTDNRLFNPRVFLTQLEKIRTGKGKKTEIDSDGNIKELDKDLEKSPYTGGVYMEYDKKGKKKIKNKPEIDYSVIIVIFIFFLLCGFCIYGYSKGK